MSSWPMLPFSMAWSSPIAGTLVAILYVVLAAAVTVDVLLKKSDVRGALGWSGLVWLARVFGSLLYYLFGINRVTRRASKWGRLESAMGPAPRFARPVAGAHSRCLSQG